MLVFYTVQPRTASRALKLLQHEAVSVSFKRATYQVFSLPEFFSVLYQIEAPLLLVDFLILRTSYAKVIDKYVAMAVGLLEKKQGTVVILNYITYSFREKITTLFDLGYVREVKEEELMEIAGREARGGVE